MNNKVKFLRGTSDEYAVAEKDNDTIYFTTDDGKLYIGDKEISGSDVTIDTTLSDTSTNPVQNKVIKQAIDNKADKTVATTSADGLMSAEDKGKLDDADNTYALKSKYGDTTIDVGRKADTTVGGYSTAEGRNTTASGNFSHAEGIKTTASGAASHTEGEKTTASGAASHAEGNETTASGDYSHAEGYFTTASGTHSHAEGLYATASGAASHAEGKETTASGVASHAGGTGTKALHDNEVAYGKYNESKDDTVFSVGDGTSDSARHNAFEITTTGGKLHDKDIATTDLIPTTLPANGGISDTARQVVGTSSKIRLWEDNEGGNLSLVAPDGVHSMEMDLYDSQGFRIYFYDGSAMYFPVSFNFNTGKFNINGDADTLDGKHANEIATNPNLLINPDFKINQRGVSGTFSETGKYFVDRWRLASGSVTVNADGTLTLNGSISQMFENAVGENVTASVSAGTAVYDNSTKTFSITANGEIISWAKLEYGSVATPFIPPDITTELLKCQRFYYRAGNPLDKNNAAESGYYCGFGMVLNSKSNIVSIFLPINMRVAPTCNNGGTLYTSYINGNNNLETVGTINFPSNNVISTKYTFGLKLNISFKDSIMKPISGSCALVIGTTPVAYGGCFALDAEIY